MNTVDLLNMYYSEPSNKETIISLKTKLKNMKIVLNIKDYEKIKKGDLIKLFENIKYYINNPTISETIKLNDNQLAIINADVNKHTVILACAGSGKTTTILYRIKYLLSYHCLPENILLLTFNKDAQLNLIEKINTLFGFPIKISIMTIDSFCYKIKKNYGYCLNNDYTSDINEQISLSELCIFGYDILRQFGREICQKYKYVFFDEYQDTNYYQAEILKIFAQNNAIITVIGDDQQNIYSFRGTNNEYILNFREYYPNSQTFSLDVNYRSTQGIVNLANKVLEFNQHKLPKLMLSNNNILTKPKLIGFKNQVNISSYVIKFITDKIQIEQCDYNNFAVLARDSATLKIYETLFTKHNLPFIICLDDKINESQKITIQGDKIIVTTIHGAKGLEWKYVFIDGLIQEMFPFIDSNNSIPVDVQIEENRRLFYVAVTRAKKELNLLYNTSKGKLSQFVIESQDFVDIPDNLKIFSQNDNNRIIAKSLTYSVTEIIKGFQVDHLAYLRLNNYFNIKVIETSMINGFTSNIDFNSANFKYLYSSGYDGDFGEYCDRYVTRGIMKHKHNIYDSDTEGLLQAILLDNSQWTVVIKYKLNKLMANFNVPLLSHNEVPNLDKLEFLIFDLIHKSASYIQQEDIPIIKEIILIISQHIKNNKNINKIVLKSQVDLTSEYLKNLKNAYNKFCDLKYDNNEIKKEIYYVSLSRNIVNDRNRLIFNDIFDLIDKLSFENKLYVNMDYVISDLNNKDIQCKMNVEYITKSDNVPLISGEIDLVEVDTIHNKNTIIDIKTSNSATFKFEWYLQLLSYYALCKIEISSLAIINVMDCKRYDIEFGMEFGELNKEKFIEFIVDYVILKKNIFCQNKGNPISHIHTNNQIIKYDYQQNNLGNYKIIFDTETSTFYGDLLQLAYVIVDQHNIIIEKKNYYIKDRISSVDGYAVHGISHDVLNKGNNINEVLIIFLNDLTNTNTLVGHNIAYDLSIIYKELLYSNIQLYDANKKIISFPNVLSSINTADTSKLSREQIKDIQSHTLNSVYKYFFNNDIINSHDAQSDVNATYEIYKKLTENNNNTNKTNSILSYISC